MSPALTPMEAGGTWATLSEEASFLAAVVAGSPAVVTPVPVGRSATNLPITAYRIQSTQGSSDDPVLVLAGQHGSEPSAREAALRLIRDLAPAPSSRPVIVIPTMNPDGIASGLRANGSGQDLNRHHVDQAAPEVNALNGHVRTVAPLFIYDGHDTNATQTGGNVPGLVTFRTYLRNATEPYVAWGDAFQAQIAAQFPDVSTGLYPLTDHEGTLTNAAANRGIPNVLVEVLITEPAADRVSWHLRAMSWVIAYVDTNRAALHTMRDAARRANRQRGFDAVGSWDGFEAGPLALTYGYRVDTPVHRPLWLLGIEAHPAVQGRGAVYVPCDQDMAPLIALLLDPAAPRPAMPARRLRHGEEAPVDFIEPGDRSPSALSVGGQPVRRVTDANGSLLWGY